jgi:hypothetical protein
MKPIERKELNNYRNPELVRRQLLRSLKIRKTERLPVRNSCAIFYRTFIW